MSFFGMTLSNFASRFSLFAGIVSWLIHCFPNSLSIEQRQKVQPPRSDRTSSDLREVLLPTVCSSCYEDRGHMDFPHSTFAILLQPSSPFKRTLANTSLLNPYSGGGGMLLMVWALLQDRHLELVNPRLFWHTGIWRLDILKAIDVINQAKRNFETSCYAQKSV